MVRRFYSIPVPLFGSVAVVLLCTVFFLLPFALRGARLGLGSIQNKVADWLPDHYVETQELEEFTKYFSSGADFVVVSGDWCKEDDPRYLNLFRKIQEESLDYESTLNKTLTKEEILAHRKGDELGLMFSGNYHEDWGEQREKWLLGRQGQWYFINRKGQLFRWEGQSNVVEGFNRSTERAFKGKNKAEGKYLATFGDPPDDENGIENPFYADPQKLCCRPFRSVISGPVVFEQMAGADGSLRVGSYSEEDLSTFEAKIEAHKRLTGSLYGPTPAPSFNWTFESLLHHVDKDRQDTLVSDPIYRERFNLFVDDTIAEDFGGDPDGLDQAKSEQKLEYWYKLWREMDLVAPPRQTCLVVTLNEPIISEMARAVGRPLLGKPRGRILELATGKCGISPENLRIGGPPSDNVAIDEEGTSTLLRLVSLSLLIGFTLAYLSFGSVRIAVMLFFIGGVAAISSLSYVWFCGQTMDAILMSMPSLVYVLALSSAVHIVNYFRDACYEDGQDLAVEKAVKHSLFPCSLAAFTTALGLVSLTTSNLTPIYKFGLFSAIATMATVVLLFTYLPSALFVWKPNYQKRTREELAKESNLSALVGRMWAAIGNWVVDHHLFVSTASIAALIFFAVGITQVQTSVQLLKLFDKDAKILHDYRWMEENVGQLVPADHGITFDYDAQLEPHRDAALKKIQQRELAKHPPGTSVEEAMDGVLPEYDVKDLLAFDLKYSMLERFELSRRVRQQLEKYFGRDGMGIVGAGMSMDVFAPLYRIDEQEQSFKRTQFSEELYSKINELLEQDYFAIKGRSNRTREEREQDMADPKVAGQEIWRVSIRLAALNNVDYGQFIGDLKTVVEPIMTAYRYRTAILKKLQSELGEKSLTEGKVLVLGPDPDRNNDDIRQKVAEGATLAELIDQTHIFSTTLQDLLENRGFVRGGSKKFYGWIDPQQRRDLGKPIKSEDLAKLIERADCVVLVQDDIAFDESMIIEKAVNKNGESILVDCRDHHFVVNQRTKQPEAGMLTAKELKQDPALAENVDITTIYTGIVPIVYKAQRSLLQSLVESIGLAFVMISGVMMLLLRDWRSPVGPKNLLNIRGGMISMLPNVFPVVVVFGCMGHLNRWYGGTVDHFLVDIGSMMTASVAMGVAVDDTIHFLNWYRQALAQGHPRKQAIKVAYERVATAMTQTTLIGGLGLSAFALSTFTPTQRFGVLMLFLLAMALVGDLILLPALLAGPLGKYFGKERTDAGGADSQDAEALKLRLVGDQAQDVIPEVILPPETAVGEHRRRLE